MKSLQNQSGRVMVMCRVRPFSQIEKSRGAESTINFDDEEDEKKSILIDNPKHDQPATRFKFDAVFDLDADQKEVYDKAARPIIASVLDGFNGTVFAYGQTGSGKTYTMQGMDIKDVDAQGVIPRMVRTLFSHIDSSPESVEFTVKVSFAEIYKEKIKDLMKPKNSNLQILADKGRGIYIQGITEEYITDEHGIYEIMRLGNKNRTTAATKMNEASSRSHALFTLTVTMTNPEDGSKKIGKLFLVDLAGSEKVSKTGASGGTLDEAKSINRSLTVLGQVIMALTEKRKGHVPYRDSKLTRILQDSLGGNSKTCMIVTLSPAMQNLQETVDSLRFGSRAMNVKNTPKQNKQHSVFEMTQMLHQAAIQIRRLSKKQCERCSMLELKIKELGGEASGIKKPEALDLGDDDLQDGLANIDFYLSGANNPELDGEKVEQTPLTREEMDKKPDELESLQFKYDQSQEQLQEAQAQMIKLQEDLKIAQEKQQKMGGGDLELKERLNSENFKYETANEQPKDVDLKLEELEQKLAIQAKELELSNESAGMFKRKLEGIYEQYVLVEKTGGDVSMDDDESAMSMGGEATDMLKRDLAAYEKSQEQVRQMFFQLQAKDSVIRKLKAFIDSDGEGASVNEIINSESNQVSEAQKAEEAVQQAILSGQPLDIESLMKGAHLSSVALQHLQDVQMQTGSKLAISQEVLKDKENALRVVNEKMEIALTEKNPDFLSITTAKVDLAVAEANERHQAIIEEYEAKLDLKGNQLKSTKQHYRKMKEQYLALQKTAGGSNEMKFKEKAQVLEKNLDQIQQMYQQINLQMQQLKMDLTNTQKKLARKEERETKLQANVSASKKKQQEYLNIIKQLKVRFMKVQQLQQAAVNATTEKEKDGQIGGSLAIQGGGKRMRGFTIRGGGNKI